MTIADYALAAVLALVCVAGALTAWLVACIDAFVPAPDQESAKVGRTGCVLFVIAIAALAYFVGVIWNGDWGWLA